MSSEMGMVIAGLLFFVLLVVIVVIWSMRHKPGKVIAEKGDKEIRGVTHRWDIRKWMLAITGLFVLCVLIWGVVGINRIADKLGGIERELSHVRQDLSGIESELSHIDFQLEMMR